MKKMKSQAVLCVLVITGALLFPSCIQVDDEPLLFDAEPVNTISPRGGILSALDDNVILSFSEGSIDYKEYFSVKVWDKDEENPYLLKTFSIEPFIKFKKPVELKIRYTGCLQNGCATIYEGMCLNVLNWQNSQDFIQQSPGNSYDCIIHEESETIDLIIYQTGIFAVGLKP